MCVCCFPSQSVNCLITRFFFFLVVYFVKYKRQYKGHYRYSGHSCGMNTVLMPLKNSHSNAENEKDYIKVELS